MFVILRRDYHTGIIVVTVITDVVGIAHVVVVGIVVQAAPEPTPEVADDEGWLQGKMHMIVSLFKGMVFSYCSMGDARYNT